jgi:hypothetical protein
MVLNSFWLCRVVDILYRKKYMALDICYLRFLELNASTYFTFQAINHLSLFHVHRTHLKQLQRQEEVK